MNWRRFANAGSVLIMAAKTGLPRVHQFAQNNVAFKELRIAPSIINLA